MKEFFRSNIFITTIFITIWIFMEMLFFGIARDAQKAAESFYTSAAYLNQHDFQDKIWYSFYLVSTLATLFMVLLLFFIRKTIKENSRYSIQNRELENSLKAEIDKLNKVLKASQSGYWEWNVKMDKHSVDEQWLSMLGLTKESLKNSSADWSDRIHKDDLVFVMQSIQNAIKTGESYVLEYRMRHADGHYVWMQGSGAVSQRDANGDVLKLSGTHHDITQRKLLEIEREEITAYLNTLFEKNPSIIIVTDGESIQKANSAFFGFFFEYDSLEGFRAKHRCICEFFLYEEGGEFITNEYSVWLDEVLESPEPLAKIAYNGEEHYFAVYAKKVYEDRKANTIVTFSNITETYRLKKRFEELSIVDELTKAYNRRHFNKLFLEEANRALREQHSFSLAILDIDNFKRYNDTYGHDAGDDVLVRFASEVKKIAQRSNEFFFRLGGEEFGLIFSDKTQEEALEYAQMICKTIEELGIEHEENLPYKKFTVSIGVAYAPASKELDLKSIYKKADQALYKAKESGRNRVEILD